MRCYAHDAATDEHSVVGDSLGHHDFNALSCVGQEASVGLGAGADQVVGEFVPSLVLNVSC